MPPIPTVVDGHTIRNPPQLDAGVCLNLYPERTKRETEYESRSQRFLAPVHGYREFRADALPVRVTAMKGSREPTERLVVANGRTLRVFDRPNAASRVDRIEVNGQPVDTTVAGATALKANRIRHPFGCAHAELMVGGRDLGPWYWVRDDGQLWWNSLHPTQRPDNMNGARVILTNPGGITPLGIAIEVGEVGNAPADAKRIFMSCFEDRIIRVWRKEDPPRPNRRRFIRVRNEDLDLSDDTAVGAPSSLWWSSHLLVLDAISGRVSEYTNPGDWKRRTPIAASNPFSIQRQVGNRETLEPVAMGGMFLAEGNVWIADRTRRTIVGFDYVTGALDPNSATQPGHTVPAALLRAGAKTWTPDGTAVAIDPVICGAVGGFAEHFYVSGSQYVDGLGRIFKFDVDTKNFTAVTVDVPPMPDVEQTDPPPGVLVPLGDRGRHVAWIVDRRLHLLDLVNDRLILDVEGNIDSVDYSVPRLVGADASTGTLKVSPVNGIRVTNPEPYGELVTEATLRVPSVSTTGSAPGLAASYTRPRRIESMMVTMRSVITVLESHHAAAYDRNDLTKLPAILNDDQDDAAANIHGVAVNGDQATFFLRDRGAGKDARDLVVRHYSTLPTTAALYRMAPTMPPTLRIDNPGVAGVHSWATDGTLIYVVVTPEVTGQDVARREIQVWDPRVPFSLLQERPQRDGVNGTAAQQAAAKVWLRNRIGQDIGFTNTTVAQNVWVPNVDLGQNPSTADRARVAEGLLFEGLEFEALQQTDWIRGITFVKDSTADGGGFLYVAIHQRPGVANRTVIRAFQLTNEGWVRAASRDVDVGVTTENRSLSHDSQFIFDTSAQLVSDQLDTGGDVGTTVRSTVMIPFRHGLTQRLSKFAWDAAQSSQEGATSVAAVRKNLYAFTPTGMELRNLADRTEGFPYPLTETRTVGLVAPHSLALVADVLYWLGITEGGGLRVWRVGHKGDGVPEYIQGKAIEEMLDTIAGQGDGLALAEAIGWSDDTGGHPIYVLHLARAGISIAYDADTDRWHVRSSTNGTSDEHAIEQWRGWMPRGQGAQRITHSTTWQGAFVGAGYAKDGSGAIGFHDPRVWTEIDGDAIFKRRQFSGGAYERERVYYNMLRVDAVYDVEGVGTTLAGQRPEYSVDYSNDGGLTFDPLGRRPIGPRGQGSPYPFYRIGYARERVYRVDCNSPAPFALRGASQEASP